MRLFDFLIFYIFVSKIYTTHVILPFTREFYPKETKDNVLESLKHNYVPVEIGFGTPKQNFKLNLNMDQYVTWVIGSEYNDSSVTFNETASSTYKPFKAPINYSGEDFNYSSKCNETLSIGDLTKKEFMVMVSSNPSKISHYNSGGLGLHLKNSIYYDTQDMNMISQLKKADVISSYAFTIRYTKKDKGEIIIGDYLHTIDPSYSPQHFCTAKTAYIYSLVWGLKFDSITWNTSELNENQNTAKLELEYGFVLGTKEFKRILEQNFFNELIKTKKCRSVTIDYSESGYECDQDADLSNFPQIEFYQKEMNYTFSMTKDDLFYSANKKQYCLLVFGDNDISWIFGEPFMRKYSFTFDQDKKIVGFYTDRVFTLGYWWIAIVILIIALCVGIITHMIIIYIRKKPKKIRMYELGDQYKYVPFRK